MENEYLIGIFLIVVAFCGFVAMRTLKTKPAKYLKIKNNDEEFEFRGHSMDEVLEILEIFDKTKEK